MKKFQVGSFKKTEDLETEEKKRLLHAPIRAKCSKVFYGSREEKRLALPRDYIVAVLE